jgi:hypothetical protein
MYGMVAFHICQVLKYNYYNGTLYYIIIYYLCYLYLYFYIVAQHDFHIR